MGARISTMENYIGKRYGKLTVVDDLGCISSGKRRMVTAICECGVSKNYLMGHLKKGDTQSCGCILKEIRYGVEFINQEIVTEDSKVCPICRILKPKTEYHKRNSSLGVQGKCKDCMAKYKKERYWSNHEVELVKYTKSRTKPENLLQRKGYYEKNKEEYRERYLKWIADEDNKKHRKAVNRKYHDNRYRNDPEYNLLIKIRARVRSALKKQHLKRLQSNKTMAYLGCTYSFFKCHIESLFTEGMTWDKLLSGAIHLDHIRPCSTFLLSDPEQQMICFNWKNVQPLWAEDNLKKNASYDKEAA